MAQLMPLPLAVSCFSKIQIGFTFLVLAHLDSPGQRAIKRVCVCVCVFNITDKGSKVTNMSDSSESVLNTSLEQLTSPVQSNPSKWTPLKWITRLNGYHFSGPV